MKESKIAQIINSTLVPNVFGGTDQGVTIAEDLRNIVDIGTPLSSLAVEDLTFNATGFVVGVVNEFIPTIPLNALTYGLYVTSEEYGGVIQRIKARFTKTYDTPILSLEDYNSNPSAPDYNDGHYYGTQFVAKLYNKSASFMIPYSIPVEMFKKSFQSKEGVLSLVALIENAVMNTIENELGTLAKSVLRRLILSAHETREIKLLTLYNQEFGYQSGDANYVTLTNWKNDTNFKIWCQETIIRLRKALTDYNMKYNDGSVEIRTDESDVRTTMLNEFATALDFANSNVYHKELVDYKNGATIYTVNYWMNGSNELLPTIKSGSVHDQIVEKVKDSGSGQTVTIDHCVSVIYSKYSGGIRERLNKTTTDYIAKGDFNNFFHHMVKDWFICEDEVSISLVLA